MNTDFKHELFRVISDEIDRPSLDADEPRRRTVMGPALAVVATGAMIAGVSVLVWPSGDTEVSTRATPSTRGAETSAASDDVGDLSDVPPDIPRRPFALAGPAEDAWRLSPASLRVPTFTPQPVPSQVSFRFADSDPRVSGMYVTPSIGMDGIELAPVETIGARQLHQPTGMVYPEGTSPEEQTGPWFWTESDGSKWTATGTLADLRRALPLVTYDGTMHLGEGLVEWTFPTENPVTLQQTRNQRFELTVLRDTTSQFEVVDPMRGNNALTTVGGRPGVFQTGGGISWRLDASTVLTVRAVAGGNLNASGMSFPMSNEDLQAAAEAVHEITPEEYATFRLWRGADVERIIVTIPDFPADATHGEIPYLQIRDLDNNGGTTVLSGFALGAGLAIPVSPEQAGHRFELSISEPTQTADGVITTGGNTRCPIEVVAPAEGEPAIEVEVSLTC